MTHRTNSLALLEDLTRLPHRGTATPCEREAAELLSQHLLEMGAVVGLQPFRTPKTYVTVVYWLIGGLVLGLLLIRPGAWWTPGLVWVYVVLAWLYFNWRYSPVVQFPVLHTSHNVIGRWAATAEGPVKKLILMAHYDTAPVSMLYGSGQKTFRASLIFSLVLMLTAAILATLEAFGVTWTWLHYARYGFMAYLVLQAITGTIGYYLHGYTNGASDNATGVVAALETADRLRQNKPADVELEVVLTSAEELGMLGAYYYVEKYRKQWPVGRTAAINFDTLGAGKLTVIEQTGTVETIRYNNLATDLARQLIQNESFVNKTKLGRWHTADFDSVWFVRQNIPVLALCALDEKGEMPRIHRPDDTLDRVDLTPMYTAIDLAEMVFRRLSVAL
jgi:hypothetical protein